MFNRPTDQAYNPNCLACKGHKLLSPQEWIILICVIILIDFPCHLKLESSILLTGTLVRGGLLICFPKASSWNWISWASILAMLLLVGGSAWIHCKTISILAYKNITNNHMNIYMYETKISKCAMLRWKLDWKECEWKCTSNSWCKKFKIQMKKRSYCMLNKILESFITVCDAQISPTKTSTNFAWLHNVRRLHRV